MATQIPLNFYRRLSKEATRVPTRFYTTPFDRASVIINALATNTTSAAKTVTVGVSSLSATNSYFTILNDFYLNPYETINLFPYKFVMSEYDSLIFSADTVTNYSITNPEIFWLFDSPTGIVSLSGLQFTMTPPASVVVNWGQADFRVRITNENFDEWSAPEVSSASITNGSGFFGPNLGALNWIQGIDIQSTNNPVGTVRVIRMNTAPEDRQYFDTTYYARTALSGVNFGSTLLWQFTGNGNGFVCTQNDYIKPIEPYLGKQVNVTFWARASQPTKIFSETQIHSNSQSTGLWTPVQWKIFDIGTTWQQYKHVYTLPTYEQVLRAGYDPGTVDVNNPQYIPLSASNQLPPLSTWQTQVDIKTLWSLGSHIRHGNHPNRPPFPGTAMSVAELSSVITSAVTNGYYDVAAVRFTIGDGTTVSSQLQSGVPGSFVYDPPIDTDTNITLSILEADNRT